jgi:hypothetical protein
LNKRSEKILAVKTVPRKMAGAIVSTDDLRDRAISCATSNVKRQK